jgi:hypothetical protein
VRVEADQIQNGLNYTVHFLDMKNDTYYVEIMGIVYLESTDLAQAKKLSEPFTFIYPMK